MEREPLVAVYVVTWRRANLLRRALQSVLSQTHANLKVVVVNDDPDDGAVAALLEELADERLSLHQPVAKRGAAANFNLAFADEDAAFGSILEDDNWWEPTFIAEMVAALSKHSEAQLAIGNERIWQEADDGSWINTGRVIWGSFDTRLHSFTVDEICGSAKLCNSALLFKLPDCRSLLTPDEIPVDVTEHFRERLLERPPLLVGKALVNYAVTKTTTRSSTGPVWGVFQCLLVGSVFAALESETQREHLARRLWESSGGKTSPRATALVVTGAVVGEARALLRVAPIVSKARTAAWAARRLQQMGAFYACRRQHEELFAFLANAPLTRQVTSQLIDGDGLKRCA